MIGISSCCLENHAWFPRHSKRFYLENIHRLPCSMTARSPRMRSQRLGCTNQASIGKNSVECVSWRTFSSPSGLEEELSSQVEEYSNDDACTPEALSEELLEQPFKNDALKALLADSERNKLIKKLSEANQQNRFLKRQLHVKDDALVNFKSELAVIELEVQALVIMAEEISKYEIPKGSRKINGKYIQSHLLSRLQAVHGKMKEQIKDVDAAQSKEVPIFWYGMAESVQVMGSFDGWSLGEYLSPKYTGSYTMFSTTLMLRPGRYEIKFLVDGEWKLSPEFPTVGEGLLLNNLLIV